MTRLANLLISCLIGFSPAITLQNAEDAFTTLLQWYNESVGLWIPSTIVIMMTKVLNEP